MSGDPRADQPAQDPDELFDVLRADGSPTGVAKPRSAVHRDGDWHRALHIWVAGVEDREPFLTFQRRSLLKDTWPGRLDATVGGHVRSGETPEHALREMEEEIGVLAEPANMRMLGIRLSVSESEEGILDREIQHVILSLDNRPLEEFEPHPVELASLVRFPLEKLLDFLSGTKPSVLGTVRPADEDLVHSGIFTMQDFVPTTDRYFYRLAIAASAALRGARHVSI